MKRRLGRHDYASIDDFDEDARLISSNCLLYNWASLPFITASTHFQQAWERFRDRAVELYPAITTARMRSTRLEIPTMDRGTYISDEPSGDEQVIQLPYILTPSELHQATATARGAAGEVLSGPGLRAIMNAVLDYMMMLDDLGQFASPVNLFADLDTDAWFFFITKVFFVLHFRFFCQIT